MAEFEHETDNNLDAFYDDHSHVEYHTENEQGDESPQQTTLREKIRLRKEAERLQNEAQFTFHPNVKAYKKGHPLANDTIKENRFDKLYGDALKRHMTSQVKTTEDLTKRDKDLTFKPKISSMGAKQSRSSSRERLGLSRSGSQSRDTSRERGSLASDSDDGLNSARKDRSRSSSRGRVMSNGHNGASSHSRGVTKLLEEQQATMTFRPNITKRAQSIGRQDAANVMERLYDQGKKVKERMEQKKTEYDQLRMQECTFAPSVVKTKFSNGSAQLDVTERLRRFEEMKKKKLEEAQKKKQEEEAELLTFKPKISQRAQSPGNVSLSHDFNNMTLEERLMTPTKRRNSKAQEEAAREFTFKPKLVTSKRAQSPNASHEYHSVHERLYVEGAIHRKELECQREQIRSSLDKELTFSPELVSKSLVARDSPGEQLFDRLNGYVKGDPEKIEKIRRDREAELTFQPQLTRKSQEITARPNDYDVTKTYERQKAEQDRLQIELEMRRQQQEEDELKELTLKPQVPEASKQLARRRSQANIDAGGDAASVFSMSVHSRLASMYTVSSANLSLSGMGDNATIMTELTNKDEPTHPRQSIVLPEEKVNQLVRRLSMHKKVEEPVSEVRAKVMSPQEYEGAVQRLSMQKTMSFTLKTDPEQLEAVQPRLVKEVPKVTQEQMDEILERLQSPTVSAAVAAETLRESPLGNNPLVRTASGRSLIMSTSQFNLLMSSAAAGAAVVHGSPSPPRRHTLMSPPRASFFGTTLAAINDVEDHHEDSPAISTVPSVDKHEPSVPVSNNKGNRRIDSLADLEVEMVEEEGTDEEEEEEEKSRHKPITTSKKPVKSPASKPTKTPSPRKSVTATTPVSTSPKKPVPSTTPVSIRGAHGSTGSRPTTPNNSSARRHSAPTPNSPSNRITATRPVYQPPSTISRAVPKSTLPTTASGTGEFVDEFEKKLAKTMAMLKPLDVIRSAPARPSAIAAPVPTPAVVPVPVIPPISPVASLTAVFPTVSNTASEPFTPIIQTASTNSVEVTLPETAMQPELPQESLLETQSPVAPSQLSQPSSTVETVADVQLKPVEKPEEGVIAPKTCNEFTKEEEVEIVSEAHGLEKKESILTVGDEEDDENNDDEDDEVDMQASSMSLTSGSGEKKKRKKKKKKGSKK